MLFVKRRKESCFWLGGFYIRGILYGECFFLCKFCDLCLGIFGNKVWFGFLNGGFIVRWCLDGFFYLVGNGYWVLGCNMGGFMVKVGNGIRLMFLSVIRWSGDELRVGEIFYMNVKSWGWFWRYCKLIVFVIVG